MRGKNSYDVLQMTLRSEFRTGGDRIGSPGLSNQGKMLSALQSPKTAAQDVAIIGSEPSSAHRRKPLQLLTGIFSRNKLRREGSGTPDSIIGERTLFMSENDNPEAENSFWGSLDADPHEDDLDIPEPREALHSPYHARTIDQDMENLRLSRQDNPYLQILASRECLHENDDCSDYEEAHLMSKENIGIARDPLEISEVHARLVRSPPPVMWTRNRNSDSEPSFSRFGCHRSNGDCVFQFPPVGGRLLNLPTSSPSHSFRSQSATIKLLSPQEYNYNSRSKNNKDKSLEALTGRFNLSPQPRRRPAENNRSFSDFN